MELSQRADVAGAVERRDFPTEGIEIREDSGGDAPVVNFSGYASVTGSPYPMYDMFGEYTETISRSAFDRTLGENPDVQFLINHDGTPLARTKNGDLTLSADDTGLLSQAQMKLSTPRVSELRALVQEGLMDQMSFAFRTYPDGNEWNDDYDQRTITGINLHRGDVSAVNFGANAAAFIASMRHARTASDVNERLFVLSLQSIRSELLSGGEISERSRTELDAVIALLPDINPELRAVDTTSAEVDEIARAQEAARSLELYKARAFALRLRSV